MSQVEEAVAAIPDLVVAENSTIEWCNCTNRLCGMELPPGEFAAETPTLQITLDVLENRSDPSVLLEEVQDMLANMTGVNPWQISIVQVGTYYRLDQVSSVDIASYPVLFTITGLRDSKTTTVEGLLQTLRGSVQSGTASSSFTFKGPVDVYTTQAPSLPSPLVPVQVVVKKEKEWPVWGIVLTVVFAVLAIAGVTVAAVTYFGDSKSEDDEADSPESGTAQGSASEMPEKPSAAADAASPPEEPKKALPEGDTHEK